MSNAVKTLRREVKRAKGVEPGTVVTFDRAVEVRDTLRDLPGEVRTFAYAAIFVGGAWHFTGAGNLGRSRMSNRDFLDLMASESISNVKVATEFEEVC